MPCLTWKPVQGNLALFRSSQPRLGVQRSRDASDEGLLQAMGAAVSKSGVARPGKLFVADCRPQVNAVANLARNGGWEITDHYPNCTVAFLGRSDDVASVAGGRELQRHACADSGCSSFHGGL